MTRFIHDQFAKEYLKELLSPIGEVETSRDVASEVRSIDVWFRPTSVSTTYVRSLGLLGTLAGTATIFEPFRNAVTSSEIRSCMGKLFDVQAQWERVSKRADSRITEEELPQLWILTPTASMAVLNSFGFQCLSNEDCPKGVYRLPSAHKTGLVAIHQLPPAPQTLWLRILGRGKVQQMAIQELAAMPLDNPVRDSALELLYNLQANLKVSRELEQEDEKLIIALAPLYRQQIDAAIEQGIERGRIEENRSILENFLRVRLGELDPIMTAFIAPVSTLSAVDFTMLLVQLAALAPDDNGVQQARRLLAESALRMRFGQLDERLTNLIPTLLALAPDKLASLLLQLPELGVEQLLARLANSES